MNTFPITIKPYGKHAVLIEWPDRVEENILNDILQFGNYLKSRCFKTKDWELVPAYNSLTLINRHKEIDFKTKKRELKNWYAKKSEVPKMDRFLCKLPVCYDTEFGLDLEELAKLLGKSIEEIINFHTSYAYTVYGIGFLPGFLYLGGLPRFMETPRKSTPRLKVLKGSVGMAGKQTGIYPQDSPGGWNIIGNCPIPIFDISKDDPCLVKVGDRIQFYSITKSEYNLHKIEAEVGIFVIDKVPLDA